MLANNLSCLCRNDFRITTIWVLKHNLLIKKQGYMLFNNWAGVTALPLQFEVSRCRTSRFARCSYTLFLPTPQVRMWTLTPDGAGTYDKWMVDTGTLGAFNTVVHSMANFAPFNYKLKVNLTFVSDQLFLDIYIITGLGKYYLHNVKWKFKYEKLCSSYIHWLPRTNFILNLFFSDCF